jgi:hypothetical protein
VFQSWFQRLLETAGDDIWRPAGAGACCSKTALELERMIGDSLQVRGLVVGWWRC